MNLAFLAIFCLSLGITSGEIQGQVNDKGIVINNDLNKESRRLLYVVGIYPEWAPRIENFKAKWGENGEKYLTKGVYIHGDVDEPTNNTTRRMNGAKMEKPTLLVLPESKDLNIIKSELPRFTQVNATDTRNDRKENKNDILKQYQEYGNFVEKILNPLRKSHFKFNTIKKDSVEKIDDKDTLQNSGNPKEEDPAENEDGLEQRRFKNINRIYRYNWIAKKGRKSKNIDKNNIKTNADNRKMNDIDKMYDTASKKENDDIDKRIQNKPAIPNENAPNYWMINQKKENLESDEGNKKYSNVDKTYSRISPGYDGNDDMDEIIQKRQMKFKGLTPLRSRIIPKKESRNIYARPGSLLQEARHKFKNRPDLELQWIKEVLLPRIVNERRNTKTTSDEIMLNPNVDDEIYIKNKNNINKLDDYTDTEENKENGNIISPSLPLAGMRQTKEIIENLNLIDDDDDDSS